MLSTTMVIVDMSHARKNGVMTNREDLRRKTENKQIPMIADEARQENDRVALTRTVPATEVCIVTIVVAKDIDLFNARVRRPLSQGHTHPTTKRNKHGLNREIIHQTAHPMIQTILIRLGAVNPDDRIAVVRIRKGIKV